MAQNFNHLCRNLKFADVMRISFVLNDDHHSSASTSARQKYQDEQSFFIWYHRTDLGLPWDQVMEMYRRYWKEDREKSGLQCKFYRILDQYNVDKVRKQTKMGRSSAREKKGKFGVLQRTNRRFPWMKPDHLGHRRMPVLRAKL
ncbi:hypothetical protein EDD36DRAFT_421630 [Exophiala viscosa]|uniref:Uncharacterized protein n=1 Tax=Exophiala viscosa TaxID=2486360 RepID=A0AAN6IB55_9EURO|nr:hypothetical protein EDD36DRAFT_421630 [Exophiala viscosa]